MQTVIVILIIAAVLFFAIRKTYRMLSGKEKGCSGCNCGCNCSSSGCGHSCEKR